MAKAKKPACPDCKGAGHLPSPVTFEGVRNLRACANCLGSGEATSDQFALALSAEIAAHTARIRDARPRRSASDTAARDAQIAALRIEADALGLPDPREAKRLPAPPPAPEPQPDPAPPPQPWPDPANPPQPWPDPANPPQPWPGDAAARRSAAARKAIANRDRFAAGRKAAATRAANLAAKAGPPPFADWVSDRIGTRHWTVGPAKRRERPLFDRILSPEWLAALRDAYARAHGPTTA